MYKIRSMVMDAEQSTGPVWTQDKNDPRITRLGVFLRKSHLDELPQLLRSGLFLYRANFSPGSFCRGDHLGDPAVPLADAVRELVAADLYLER